MTPSKLMEIKEQHSFLFCFAPHDNLLLPGLLSSIIVFVVHKSNKLKKNKENLVVWV